MCSIFNNTIIYILQFLNEDNQNQGFTVIEILCRDNTSVIGHLIIKRFYKNIGIKRKSIFVRRDEKYSLPLRHYVNSY